MAILKIFLAIFFVSPIVFAQTGSSRECDATLREILQANGVKSLPPRSSVVELNTIFKGIQDAKLDLSIYRKKHSSNDIKFLTNEQKEELKREENGYKRAIDKVEEVRDKLLSPFEFTEGTTEQEVKSQVDRVEKYGSSEEISIYTKKNRIVGVGFFSQDRYEGYEILKFYQIDKYCEVEDINVGRAGFVHQLYKVNLQFCARSSPGSGLRARLNRASGRIVKTYTEACEEAGGTYLAEDKERICLCTGPKQEIRRIGEFRKYSAQKKKYKDQYKGPPIISINPFVKNCSGQDISVEEIRDEIKDLVDDNGGFVATGSQYRVRKIQELCDENSKILEKATLPHRRQTTPASGQK